MGKKATPPDTDLRYIVRHVGRDGHVSWVVKVNRKDAKGRCVFPEKEYGNPERALQEACKWRDTHFPQITAKPSPAHCAMQHMHESSQKEGVICLDTEWLGAGHRYRFHCQHGHEWKRTGSRQRANPRCSVCSHSQGGFARRRPHNLEKLHNLVHARGGQCLNEEYLGVMAHYQFRCAAGHEWVATGRAALRGTWCGQCFLASRVGKPMSEATRQRTILAKRLPDGLQRLQQHAQSRGGRCLSDQYVDAKTRYSFCCAKGHEWETSGSLALRGAWCSLCSFEAKRLTLEHAHQAAQARGGRCLSTSYHGKDKHLMWECDRGHGWRATLASVRNQGSWCPDCANMAQIANRKSKAGLRYADAGKHLMDTL